MGTAIRSVGLCLKPDSPPAGDAARILEGWLVERGVRVEADREAARWLDTTGHERSEMVQRVDLMVVLGGTARCWPWHARWGAARFRFSG